MIIIIAAYDKNRIIGNDNDIPWNIPEERKFFRNFIKNKKVLIGLNTFLSINKVIKFESGYILANAEQNIDTGNLKLLNSPQQIANEYLNNKEKDIYIIGGQKVYETFVDFADEFIISHIKEEYEGNHYFPTWNVQKFSKREVLLETDDFKTIKYTN